LKLRLSVSIGLVSLCALQACDLSSANNGGDGGGGNTGSDGSPPPPPPGADLASPVEPADLAGNNFNDGMPLPDWPSAACQAQTAMLLGQMNRMQKAGQMLMAPNPSLADVKQYVPGAVFAPGGAEPGNGKTAPGDWAAMTDSYYQAAAQAPLAIPILYGLDAVHGQNGATGTVIFPHNAGLASSRDSALATEVAQITAFESMATGVSWAFAPVVSVAWDDRWGRVYESFSEDPTLTGQMAVATVFGLQGASGLGSGKPGLVSCAKHWAGDGQALAGTSSKGGIVDRGNIVIDEPTMEQYGIAPYVPAIQAGLGCIMISDARWNGQNITSNSQMITTLLKGKYGFKGFVITDWQAADEAGGVEATINAGVDMLMQPNGWQAAINTIATSNAISMDRINDAVTRILNVKCQAGLFNYKRDPAQLPKVGSAEHRAIGRKAVAASLVLLQNNNGLLPLPKTSKVWLGGSGANSLNNQCGGWTISWQGNGAATTGTTISQAIGKVTTPVANMADADVAVVVLSEGPYAEFLGDSATLNTLPANDFTLLDQARGAGKPVVAIILSGRPVLITDHVQSADAWIAGWLPGTEGDGVADVLFGTVAPTGKLSHSWPRSDDQANVHTCCNGAYDPLFPLGFGLTY
jgi:beta-glucosidase